MRAGPTWRQETSPRSSSAFRNPAMNCRLVFNLSASSLTLSPGSLSKTSFMLPVKSFSLLNILVLTCWLHYTTLQDKNGSAIRPLSSRNLHAYAPYGLCHWTWTGQVANLGCTGVHRYPRPLPCLEPHSMPLPTPLKLRFPLILSPKTKHRHNELEHDMGRILFTNLKSTYKPCQYRVSVIDRLTLQPDRAPLIILKVWFQPCSDSPSTFFIFS